MILGAFAVVIKDDKVLLVQPHETWHIYANHWNFPGGTVESDESFEVGALRETLEETGIVCEIDELLLHEEIEEDDIILETFLARYVSGEIEIQPEEISVAEWFTIEEALELPLAFKIKDILVRLTPTVTPAPAESLV